MKALKTGGLAVVAVLVLAASAQAWEGMRWLPNTCGADLVSPKMPGPLWVQVSDESGVLYESSAIPGGPFTASNPMTFGGFSHDIGVHRVVYKVANAADHTDGLVVFSQWQANCAALKGDPGPPGTPGQPGLGYGCDGKVVPPGQTPPTCETKILVPQTTCTSKRVYRFLVRKRYEGHLIRSVRAKDPDAKMSVKRIASGKLKGRLQVTADYRGRKFSAFTHQRHIEVQALVATRGWLVLNEDADLCRPANGKQNAPSASGDAKPDTGSADAARVGAVASST